ncbi:uncharacterized protein FTJAE_1086 [Fusarium tjaetaba]|uniref:2EXR domain-containing protein n=1 Tax=Fusarium tjaetaba TaxID=1567544 RepID=A0A8H5S931_9HYPO|nr:uncharacterized protein FTJAE_1086 [Fusarium tjaetaba]KAF5649090.1 hypothetical protein FTJAE_1086 [Fusarium tjaetaba]
MDDSNQSSKVKPFGKLVSLLNQKFPNSDSIFHLFPRLPMELRLMIWELSLKGERYIKVELCTINKRTGKMRFDPMPFKSWRLAEPYGILLHHPPKRSALFITSVESRTSAQRFYRVALPCIYIKKSPSAIDSLEIGGQNTEHNPQGMALVHGWPHGKYLQRDRVFVPGTFALNPELDTLEIDGVSLFANFANDVWKHDPRKVGLRHVAFLPTYTFSASQFRNLPLYAPSKELLRQVVARLQSVTFAHYAQVDKILYQRPTGNQGLLNYCCSLPVGRATGNFSRQQDPRLIGHEVLENIFFDITSRPFLGQPYKEWMEMAKTLGVTTPCVYKITYATLRNESPIGEGWERQLRKRRYPYQLQRLFEEAKGQVNGGFEIAIGFWSFPVEALDQFSRYQNLSDRQLGGFYGLCAAELELCLFGAYPSRLRPHTGHQKRTELASERVQKASRLSLS